MELQLTEFVSAGFLVTREIDRPSYVSAALLPRRMVSASHCIAQFIPDTWCIGWTQDTQEERAEHAKAFGLESPVLEELTVWITERFDKSVRWPNIISDLETAKELISRFLSNLRDVRILELGLHESMVDRFCHVAEPPPQKPGFAPNGRQGVHEVILEAKLPNREGNILGFEPLVFCWTLSCSWLCNSLDIVIDQALSIKPNHYGFIETFDDACKCVEYISRDDVGAEPGLWLPWLMIDHTEKVQ